MARPQRHVFVCTQNRPPGHPRGSCASQGGQDVAQAFWQILNQRNLWGTIALTHCGCIGPCERGANVLVYPEGVLYSGVKSADVPAIVDQHLLGGEPVAALCAPAEAW